MSYCDDQYTFTAKPSAPSYTVVEKSTATYSITDEPCAVTVGILTEDGYLITEEDGRGLTVEGVL